MRSAADLARSLQAAWLRLESMRTPDADDVDRAVLVADGLHVERMQARFQCTALFSAMPCWCLTKVLPCYMSERRGGNTAAQTVCARKLASGMRDVQSANELPVHSQERRCCIRVQGCAVRKPVSRTGTVTAGKPCCAQPRQVAQLADADTSDGNNTVWRWHAKCGAGERAAFARAMRRPRRRESAERARVMAALDLRQSADERSSASVARMKAHVLLL